MKASRGADWRRAFRLWLIIGIGIKRWLLTLAAASALLGAGLIYLVLLIRNAGWFPRTLFEVLTLGFLPPYSRILLLLLFGIGLLLLSLLRLGRNLVQPFRDDNEDVAEALNRHRLRGRGPRIVAIGGGTGMPGLLRGLKEHTGNLTAIVTVADDGGSSGRLRRELGLLPPGDFRNNIAAMARDEALMTQLIQYRFNSSVDGSQKSELGGHAFGNLLIAALTGITGSFDEALLQINRVLAMSGRVVPATLDDVTLVADKRIDGERRRISGESLIGEHKGSIERIVLQPRPRAYPPAIQAILQAKLVVMGPGSLYTSLLPNLLVPEIAEALRQTRATTVFVCNVATQPGETDDFTVADHYQALERHVGALHIDYLLANNNLTLSPQIGGGNTQFVRPNSVDGVKLVLADLVDEERPWRHDSGKVAVALFDLLRGGGEGVL